MGIWVDGVEQGGGGGGGGLPVAGGAGEVPISTGAGTTYVATGLGGAATLNVGTTAGTVAAGNAPAAAISALGLGGAATLNVGTTAGTVAAGDAPAAAAAAITTTSLGAVPTSRTVAGTALSADISTATLKTSLGIGTVLATGADQAAARTSISVYSVAETDAAITTTVGGLLYKSPCRAVAVAPVAVLSGYPTIDGVTIQPIDSNKRVLLTAQTDAKQNGPWVTASGAWFRPVPTELQACAAFPVESGTIYHDTVWYLTTNDPIVSGVTDIAISQLALNIPSTQISDSTVAGRAMLTAASVAAQNSLLGIGVASALSNSIIPLTGYAVSTGPLTAIAWVSFNPSLYAISGKTTVITLETIGSVSAAALTGTATLQNLTDAASAATISIVATTPTLQSAIVAVPAAAKIYELRLSLVGGGYVAAGALLRITWS